MSKHKKHKHGQDRKQPGQAPQAQAQAKPAPAAGPVGDKALSKRGLKVVGIGIAVVIAGFVILSRADPGGTNWAANLAPFVILGGYAVIGTGIVLKDPLI